MEFIVCLLLAAIFTGGRAASDIIHAAKGTTPAHLEKARLKAQTSKPARARSSYADGKPRLRDVAAVYWGDAMADAITSHNRRREEKQNGTRVPVKERAKRLWQLLWQPVGEGNDRAPAVKPAADEAADPTSAQPPTHPAVTSNKSADPGKKEPMPEAQFNSPEADRNRELWRESQQTSASHQRAAAVAAPTGEAVNYETTVAELEVLIERLRAHLESTIAAVASIRQAKVAISDSQQSYNPAAAAAGSISEHLPALNVDAETVGHTGTVANAMPPNDVDNMFDQLEAMEASAVEQQSNAEAALGSAEQALKVVQEKYGDANATVQGELAGDSRFLSSSGVAA